MQDILNELVKSVVVASIGLVGPMIVALLVQLFRKAKVELDAAQEATLRSVVQNVLLEVEEWAAHRLKASIPVTSGQKLGRAIEAIVEKIPNVSEEEAEQLVRQELPKVGLGAISFLEQAAKAASSKED